jgi:hypothetical protein
VTTARRPFGIDLQRPQLVAGEHAGGEGVEAGHAQAFGAGEGLAGGDSTYFQSAPAPASSSTLTTVRSTMARARTGAGTSPSSFSSSALRSTPPASKWRQRLWNGMCSLG